MTRYELLYVIPATYAETELQPVIDAITKDLAAQGVTFARNEMVGKLKLTYPIGQARYGYFVLADMEAESAKLGAINELLRLHSDVLRHHVVVKNPKAKPVFKLAAMEEIDRERGPRSERADKADRDTRARQAAGAPADGKKVEVNMEEVEKKIDNILEGKIV